MSDQVDEPATATAEITKNNVSETTSSTAPTVTNEENAPEETSTDRMARFKALKARAKKSTEHNLKEAAAESHRLSTDTSQLNSIARKHAIASHNLLKADTEASGEDFERKRAWDWTVEESERWDKRLAKKQRARDNVAFADYHQNASVVYKRQMRDMHREVDVQAYKIAKDEATRRAAASGGLEIVESEDADGNGELVAVDAQGNVFSSAENVDFVMKPSKDSVDRLVGDLKKAEEVRMKKRRDRGKGPDDADVTYINDKNKQFNQKLARFYDKYTTEIRENFERGTAI